MANQIALLAPLPSRRRGDRRARRAHAPLRIGRGRGLGGRAVRRGRRRATARSRADDVDAAALPDDRNLPRTRARRASRTRTTAAAAASGRARSVDAVAARARARGLALHLDGARIWNAAVATRRRPSASWRRRSTPCRACFSKGLGAPVGSVIAGAARRRRARAPLPQDARRRHAPGRHPRARPRSTRSSTTARASPTITPTRAASPPASRASRGVRVDADKVETNIVIFEVDGRCRRAELARRTEASGVRLHAIAPTRLRAVTHLDVDAAGIDRAIAAVRAALRAADRARRWTQPPKRRRQPPTPRSCSASATRRSCAGAWARSRTSRSRSRRSASSRAASPRCSSGSARVGGAAAGIVWPLGVAFSLIVALCMAEVASAFPDRGRPLSLERDPRRQGLGLGDGLVQPARPGVRDRRRQRRRVPAVRALRRADARDRSGAASARATRSRASR